MDSPARHVIAMKRQKTICSKLVIRHNMLSSIIYLNVVLNSRATGAQQ